MKNSLGNDAVARIAQMLNSACQQSTVKFDKKQFEQLAITGLNSLELKQRVHHIIDAMTHTLPQDFSQTSAVLVHVPDFWIDGSEDDSYSVFAAWPIIDYVAVQGLEQPELALETLHALTKLFSAEFAIRPFIIKYPTLCFEFFATWANDDDEHVRRLVSEGTRPKLPWGIQLKALVKDPTPSLPLLKKLSTDTSLYVRRSVANHLNDIAKDHPELVIETCLAWQKAQPAHQDLAWVIRHATRTLVKNGHPKSFSLLGFTANPKVTVSQLTLSSSELTFGEEISMQFEINSSACKAQSFVVDYAVHFMKANGKQAAKVFKLKNCQLTGSAENQTLQLTKKHSFKKISTRKYYAGEHKIEILINGKSMASKSFMLCAS